MRHATLALLAAAVTIAVPALADDSLLGPAAIREGDAAARAPEIENVSRKVQPPFPEGLLL